MNPASTSTARRQIAVEWLALVAVLLIGGAVIGRTVRTEQTLAREAEVERLKTQARIVDDNLSRQIEGVRNALQGVRDELRMRTDNSLPMDGRLLKTLKGAMPGVRAIVVLDPTGRVLASSDPITDRKLRDLTFLDSIGRMVDADKLYVSQPYDGEGGVPTIKLSMALLGRNDAPAGVVAAVLNPEYFEVVMQSVLYAPDMWSTISETHGRLLLVMPESAGVQGPAMFEPGSMFTRHLASGEAQTVMIGSQRKADDERLTVQRTLSPDSVALEGVLVVAVSRSLAAVQRHWYVLGWVCSVAWLLFAGVLVAGLATIQRRRTAFNLLQAERARERIDHAERIELALTGASLALWDRDVPKGKHVPDATTGAMLGYSADELRRSGVYWEEMLHPDDLPAARQMLDAHLRGDSEAYEAEYRMRHKDGRWVWIHSRGKVVERSVEGAPLRMVGTRMDITERRLAEDEIQRLAFYDGLTGLPNRRLLLDRLCHAIATAARRAVHGALLFIDLDHFKDLNDTLGHDMGDRLLADVADRLRHMTREVDTVARLGGDEFVLLIADLGESADEAARAAEAIAKKLLATLALPYRLDHHDVYSTPSIGITVFDGNAHSMDDLLKQADLAMYQAKGAGRNTVRFFDPGMQASVTHSAALEGDLRHALRRREVQLHYQPVVDLQQRIVGAEALLRWRHPTRGMVSPADFIPLAEKTGLILPLGQWVLETACQQLALWAGKADTEHLTIAVNVSARQFRQADFVSQVLAVLEQTRANPRRLKLELTESMLLNDVEDVIAKMSRLKHEGVSFALDDFGTGYSSLAYLKRLPLDQLKIDKAFVQNVSHDPNDASIARAIIALARSLNLDVVAEGVETRSQRDFLAENGCPTFQGYLFGRPGPIEDLLPGSGRGNARPGPPPSRWLPMFPGTTALST